MRGSNPVTDAMVAGYLAKYSTKGTEATGHVSAASPTTPSTCTPTRTAATPSASSTPAGSSAGEPDYHRLRRWAHMLGFGGHFLTKARRYSVTFGALRAVRIFYRRNETTGPQHGPIRTADHADEETTLVIGNFRYAGTGWHTTGDALLANTAADHARRRREAGREELAHDMRDSALTPSVRQRDGH